VEAGSDEAVRGRRWLRGTHLVVLSVLVSCSGYGYMKLRGFLVHAETQNRLKYLGAAMWFYSSDFDDRVPLSHNWGLAIRPHLHVKDPDQILRDPFLSGQAEERGFGMNVAMAGQHLSKLDDQSMQVLLAQTMSPGFSAAVTPATLRFCDTGDGSTWVLPTSTLPRKVKLADVQKWKWKPVLRE